MEIKISQPLNLALRVSEIDEHLPSIKFEFRAESRQLGYVMVFEGGVWIACEIFDRFLKDLTEEVRAAELTTIEDEVFIRINKIDGHRIFMWSTARNNIDVGKVSSSFEAKISEEIFAGIKGGFLQFPK